MGKSSIILVYSAVIYGLTALYIALVKNYSMFRMPVFGSCSQQQVDSLDTNVIGLMIVTILKNCLTVTNSECFPSM
jgi:maltodextrin utilization protein YvdJ